MPPNDPGLDERVCRKLGWEPGRQPCIGMESYWPPPVSSSWEWAGKALEDWAKKYPHSAIHLFLRDNVVYCTLDPENGCPNTLLIGTGPTAPAAIAEAIAALEDQ